MAQPATGPAGANTARGGMQFKRAAGKVTKIDGKAITIAVTENGATSDVVVTCTDTTRITKSPTPGAGAAATTTGIEGARARGAGRGPAITVKFEDLKVGQTVYAAYSATDNTARMIRITADVAAPESGAGAATTTK